MPTDDEIEILAARSWFRGQEEYIPLPLQYILTFRDAFREAEKFLVDKEKVYLFSKSEVLSLMIWAEEIGKNYIGSDKEGQTKQFLSKIDSIKNQI